MLFILDFRTEVKPNREPSVLGRATKTLCAVWPPRITKSSNDFNLTIGTCARINIMMSCPSVCHYCTSTCNVSVTKSLGTSSLFSLLCILHYTQWCLSKSVIFSFLDSWSYQMI